MKHLKIMLFHKTRFNLILSAFILLFVFVLQTEAQTDVPFLYTGAVQTFVVPCGTYSVNVKAWGGGGSGGGADSYIGAPGGGGGFVQTDIAVTPGQVLTVIVGGGGGPGGNCAGSAPGGTGGWGNGLIAGGRGGNAGASGCSGGGGAGGGASAIYNGATELLVAGGGGGGSGGGLNSAGGAGGAGGGTNGNTGSGCSIGIAGSSANGNGNAGGDRGGADGAGGGGGGGGHNGGSAGGSPPGCDCGGCGGGGGNSYSSGTGITITNGSGQTPGNSGDPGLPSGGAIGGYHSAGGNGFVILTYNGGPPVARFKSTTVCNGNATQFTDSSTTVNGALTLRGWDFGDGSPINTATNPTHTYAAGGTYNVKLAVTNTFSCIDTITKPVQVYYNPTTSYTHADVCLGDSVHFNNTSTIDPSTSISTYLWVFGDGSATSSLTSPGHFYATEGTYTVTLVATSANQCSNASIATIKVFDAPHSSFTFSNECLIHSVLFSNASTNPTMGIISNWSWNFGDGSPLNTTTLSPTHLYAAPGNYQVTLISHSSNLGCPDTLKDSVTVYPMPVANFSFTDVCLHQQMNFNDSSKVSSGTIASRSWDFGDGTLPDATTNPTHLYTNYGTFSVTLVVTTNNGCKDTVTKNVTIHPLPFAHFNLINVCDGSPVPFTNTSTIPAGVDSIQTWKWTFGDGNFANTKNTSHLYASAGFNVVQLLAVSNFGCADSITKISIVNPNPVVIYTATDTLGCAPLCVNFQNASQIASGTNAHFLWTFGDGSPTSTLQTIAHCYSNDSVYSSILFTPTLKVTSDSGCVTTISKNNQITTYPTPKAKFMALPQSTSIINPIITMTDQSTGANFWKWNFGDNDSTALSTPPPHTYADTGTYSIKLIVSTQYNCVDITSQTVIIEPDFTFYIPNAFSPNGDGVNDTFMGQVIFIKEFKMSIFDRWGNLIFTTDDVNTPWDGKVNHGGDIAQRDVYVYNIVLTDLKNKKHSYKGTVTLVR
jgi:gliding motility-associated-like protein